MADHPPFSGVIGAPAAAIAPIVTGWTDDGANVRLTTAADTVSIGTAVPVAGRKVTVLTTGVNQGLRVSTTASTDNVLDALNGAEAFARMSLLTDSLSFGGGAAAVDVRAWRSGAGALTIDNGTVGGQSTLNVSGVGVMTANDAVLNANTDVLTLVHSTTGLAAANLSAGLLFRGETTTGTIESYARIAAVGTSVIAGALSAELAFFTCLAGSGPTERWRVAAGGSWVPSNDNSYPVGTASLRVSNIRVGTAYQLIAVLGDANPTAQITSATLKLGLNTADNLSTRLYCTANKSLTVDDGAAGPLTDFKVLGMTSTQGRTGGVLTRNIAHTGYTAVITDETILWDVAGGNCLQLLPAAVTGRTLTIKHDGPSANTLGITPAGVERIDATVGPAVLYLTSWQCVHLRGVTGVGWSIV